MKIEHTGRGFAICTFMDRNGKEISLQKSSIATEECIWFGPNNPEPILLVPREDGQGGKWIPVPFPEGTSFHTRAHLTREQIKELLPYIQKLEDTGEIE